MPHFRIPAAPVAWLAQLTRLDLLAGLMLLGCLATGAFAQDQDCESRLTGSPAAMVEQKSAPDPVDPAPDKKFLPSDFSARVSQEADRAKSTRDGVRTEISAKELIDSEFTVFDPAYALHRRERQNRFHELRLRFADAKRLKEFRHCSEQLFKLSRVLVEYTAHWPLADAALDRLEHSLDQLDQGDAGKQKPNGAWGGCVDDFVFELDQTVDALDQLSSESDARPKLTYPLNFLSRIEQPDKLLAILYSHQISNIASTGVFNRESLASLSESVPQLLFKSYLGRIAGDNGANFLTEGYRRSYLRFLNDTQDPSSGFWGPWLSLHGGIHRLLDLSITYHIVAYRGGCVARWPQIIETLFEIKDLPYPYGWLWRGQLNDHNDYDIVRFFRMAWPKMSETQRQRARAEIQRMVDWTLGHSFTQDGTLIFDKDFYDSLGAAYYFAIAFLDEVGFWREEKRFWNLAFAMPERATALCTALRSELTSLTGASWAAESALTKLQANCTTP